MGRAVTLLVLLLAQPGVAVPQAKVVDRIVARIEDDILTQSEVCEFGGFQQLVNSPSAGAQSPVPGEAELIERLIDQWIVLTEATAARFPKPAKADVQKELERLAAQFGSADTYRVRLQALGLTAVSVTRNVERGMRNQHGDSARIPGAA